MGPGIAQAITARRVSRAPAGIHMTLVPPRRMQGLWGRGASTEISQESLGRQTEAWCRGGAGTGSSTECPGAVGDPRKAEHPAVGSARPGLHPAWTDTWTETSKALGTELSGSSKAHPVHWMLGLEPCQVWSFSWSMSRNVHPVLFHIVSPKCVTCFSLAGSQLEGVGLESQMWLWTWAFGQHGNELRLGDFWEWNAYISVL